MQLFGWLPVPVVITSLVCIVVLKEFLRLRKEYQFWAKQKIYGSWTIPYIGPMYKLFAKDRLKLERESRDKYGKINVEPAINGEPRLNICEPDIIRQVLVKDFDSFTDHKLMPYANKYQSYFLVWLKGDDWRKVRSLMSPTFTSGKIRKMFKFLQACADDLVAHFGEHIANRDKATINLMDIYGLYTMDGIITCGYGIKLKRESGDSDIQKAASRNDFLKCALGLLNTDLWRLIYPAFLPKFILKLIDFRLSPDSKFEPLMKRVNELVQRRKQSNITTRYDDLLQMLIDANLDDKLELNELDQAENHHAGLTHEDLLSEQAKMVKRVTSGFGKTKLSDDEVLSEAAFMIVAGMDTTRILLTSCSYTLAFHQNVQDKLYEELKKLADGDNFTYEGITSCDYLDAVISETLRILPPALKTDRVACRDYVIEKKNITIPKGSQVMAAIYAVQSDPDYWYKPLKFNPDRFMPGMKDTIVPGSYLPFGLGPRHCIGMRFSLTEAKIGLAKVLMKYKFRPAAGTKFPPRPSARLTLLTMDDPLVEVSPRIDEKLF